MKINTMQDRRRHYCTFCSDRTSDVLTPVRLMERQELGDPMTGPLTGDLKGKRI
jgi:hypothetical protein